MSRFSFICVVVVLLFYHSSALALSRGKTYELRAEDVEQAIGASLQKSEVAKHPRAVITNNRQAVLYEADHPITVEINGLEVDSAKDTWVANMLLLNEKNVVSARPISGRYEEQVQVPTLKHRFAKGEVIDADDIKMRYISEYKLQSGTITEIDTLIGMTPSRTISPDRPIRTIELMKPMVMSKGAIVQMLYQTATIDIRTIGEALDEGSVGDTIRVRNLDSRQVVHTKIISSKEVAVESVR